MSSAFIIKNNWRLRRFDVWAWIKFSDQTNKLLDVVWKRQIYIIWYNTPCEINNASLFMWSKWIQLTIWKHVADDWTAMVIRWTVKYIMLSDNGVTFVVAYEGKTSLSKTWNAKNSSVQNEYPWDDIFLHNTLYNIRYNIWCNFLQWSILNNQDTMPYFNQAQCIREKGNEIFLLNVCVRLWPYHLNSTKVNQA